MDTLVLGSARISTSEDSLSFLEVGSGLSGLFGTSLTEVIPVLSAEVAGIVASFVTWNDGAKALGGSLNWSIDKRELSNVVLVDHSKDGLLLANVDLWISNILLIGGLEFPLYTEKRKAVSFIDRYARLLFTYKAIITDQVGSFLLGFTVDSVERGWQTA